jgi:hypothetical protein
VAADQPVFPNYFELLQNIAQPFFAKSASGASPTDHAAAMAFAALDPKELERKIAELETVLAWLKAQVGMVELSVKTLEYQKSFLEGLVPATSSGSSETTPDVTEAIKSAMTNPAMNPALWAWNLLQQAQGGAGGAAKPEAPSEPVHTRSRTARTGAKAGKKARKKTP